MTESMIPGGIEGQNAVSNLSEASQEDLVRVSESMQKASQMGGAIREDQKKNSAIAHFFTFLFSAISDEDIWAMVVDLFSTNDGVGAKSLAIYEIIALFLPLYALKADELGVTVLFPDVTTRISLSRDTYAAYIRELQNIYPLYREVDRDTLITLVISLLTYHHIVAFDTPESEQEAKDFIRQSLA